MPPEKVKNYLSRMSGKLSRTVLRRGKGSNPFSLVDYTSYSFVNILKDKCLRQSMSRRGNCWDNAPQESFFGHMKDHIKEELAPCLEFYEVKDIVDRYMNYYNNQRYQWQLAKLSPNEFYKFYTTGTYPLDIPNKPAVPIASKSISELGAGKKSRDSMLGVSASVIP
jgi:putative transposase